LNRGVRKRCHLFPYRQKLTSRFHFQGYTGEQPAADAAQSDIELSVVKRPQAKRGFVLLRPRWVVERSFGWLRRFRQLARDYERLATTLVWPAFTLSRLLA
jgi:transposase